MWNCVVTGSGSPVTLEANYYTNDGVRRKAWSTRLQLRPGETRRITKKARLPANVIHLEYNAY